MTGSAERHAARGTVGNSRSKKNTRTEARGKKASWRFVTQQGLCRLLNHAPMPAHPSWEIPRIPSPSTGSHVTQAKYHHGGMPFPSPLWPPVPVPLAWVPQGRGFRASRIVACLGTRGPLTEESARGRRNGGATLNRGGEREGAGRTDRSDESERNFTPRPAVCASRIFGARALVIARGMRTYCAGEVVRSGTVR